ncbi:hypothetical protein GQ53DRAFT_664708 [Thozetella sp. PMI_491]|nr:hypothetical protein GQ53DRAFT_664708 [Thozetella sp. PMI_491]
MKRRQQRRGPFQDPTLRQQTANTRKLKACVRCRMQKTRCETNSSDPSGICMTCQAVAGKQRVYHLPCLRYRITECTLYRTGRPPGMAFTYRWPVMKLKDITEWSSPDIRTIHVLSDVCPVPLKLSVRKFKAIPEDSLHRAWMDGKVKKFKQVTPYAIVDMSAAVNDMRDFITTNMFRSWDHFLSGSDELVLMTYEFAKKHMERCQTLDERRLMGNTFRLVASARRTFTIENIVGEDKLDMEPEMSDRSFPLFGKVPLPPVMIQQLDMILTLGILTPLRKAAVEDLQKLMMANRPRSWLTIYLVCFFSLEACAAMTDHNYRNARKHGLKACTLSLRRYLIPTFIDERHHAANVYLSHFHYCNQLCNPFTLDWKNRQSTPFADITPEEILFIEATKKIVKKKQEEFENLRNLELCEHPLYFVSQLYEENWSPRDKVIEYGDATINDVPLAKYYRDKN